MPDHRRRPYFITLLRVLVGRRWVHFGRLVRVMHAGAVVHPVTMVGSVTMMRSATMMHSRAMMMHLGTMVHVCGLAHVRCGLLPCGLLGRPGRHGLSSCGAGCKQQRCTRKQGCDPHLIHSLTGGSEEP